MRANENFRGTLDYNPVLTLGDFSGGSFVSSTFLPNCWVLFWGEELVFIGWGGGVEGLYIPALQGPIGSLCNLT